MKKIPTLFKREFEGHRIVNISSEVTDGFEWVLNGEGVATIKIDGSCCAIIDGKFYLRYDAKKGRSIPDNAIKCQENADPITGHLPCWIPYDASNPGHKWYGAAFDYSYGEDLADGTYEAVGRHFNGNPYNMKVDMLVKHGALKVEVERTFEGIKEFLKENKVEGLVFWKDGEPQCKIKRSDFGFEWPCFIEKGTADDER